jgi:hypothetical protein
LEKLITFSEEDVYRILQKITNSDSSKKFIRTLVGNEAVADCGILMECLKKFLLEYWRKTSGANTSDDFGIL